jgi:hypothetical protein
MGKLTTAKYITKSFNEIHVRVVQNVSSAVRQFISQMSADTVSATRTANMAGFSRIRTLNGFEVHNIHILAHIKIKTGHKYRHRCSIALNFYF